MFNSLSKGVFNQLNPDVLFTKDYSNGWTGDGVNDYGDISHNSWDEESTFTAGAWVKCLSTSSVDFGIFGTLTGSPVNNDGVGFMIHHSLDSKLKVFFGSPTVPDFVCATEDIIPFNEYVFCVYTWNGTTIKIYINGVLQCEGTATFVHNSHKHTIGDIYATNSNLAWRFNGEIAQFFAIENVLEEHDIFNIYNFKRGVRYSGLNQNEFWYSNIKHWCDMDAGFIGIDETANNNDFTIYS